MTKQIYGLIGHPLKHSFSYKYFNEKFLKEQIDAEYLNFDISQIDLFAEIIKEYTNNISGLNVTIPYKEKIIPFLSRLDVNALEIGAVNVVKIVRDKNSKIVELVGYNSDILGFQHSIQPLIDSSQHKKALVLGTGGASKAVIQALKNLGLQYKYVSRKGSDSIFSYSDLDKPIIEEYTVIINTTPLGTFPDIENAPQIPYKYLSSKHLLYDLVYNPAETKFLRLGKEHGSKIKNGAEMLNIQANEAWKIWNP